jgi:hypothetical protein
MQIYPTITFAVTTSASVDAVRARLLPWVAQKEAANTSSFPRFRGRVESSNFQLIPIIGYKNGFIPVAFGQMRVRSEGTLIQVRNALTTWSMIFIWVWSGLFLPVLVLVVFGIYAGEISWPWALHPAGMLLFGWMLVIGGYWLEAPSMRDNLMLVLSERETSQL